MRKCTIFMIAFSMVLLSVVTAQEKGQKDADYQHIVSMLQDSTLANKLIEHISKDDNLRQKMMQEMMTFCKSDSTKMQGMCKMMMQDKETGSMMRKMMHGEIEPISIKPTKSYNTKMKVKK